MIAAAQLLLILLVLVSSPSGTLAQQSSLPPNIYYSVTVRDFMAQPCRLYTAAQELTTNPNTHRNNYCPDDANIRARVLSGELSGHPDFERNFQNRATDGSYDVYPGLKDLATGRYSSKYGTNFPLTNPTSTNLAKPFVTTDLSYGTTGIPKMTFCNAARAAAEGYVCDWNQTSRFVNDEESFSTWYEDSRKYNRRIGYQQRLDLNPTTKNYYNPKLTRTGTPMTSFFYDPIQSSGQLSKVWPLSPRELGLPNDNKFWFTAEIHTSFQYNGTESFFFKGDDDVHVFINERLAINLGGVHSADDVTINLASYETQLNLTRGNVYQFDMFHAERQVTASNFELTTTLAATCNVITSNFTTQGRDVENSIDWTSTGSTSNEDWVVIAGPGWGTFELGKKEFNLMLPSIPNVVSYLFYRPNQVNVGSGFSFKFEYLMTGGEGHGFAVLFHNRELGLRDFNGGTGPNLGIKNNDNSFAIVFDVTDAAHQKLRIHYNLQGDRRNSVADATRTKYDPDVIQNWKDNTWHSVEVMYYSNPDWLEVYIDSSLRLREKAFNMTAVTGGKNAYIGFSASSSETGQYLTTKIRNVEMKTVKVLPKYSESRTTIPASGLPLLANGRNKASFSFFTRDACQNVVDYGGLGGLVQGRMVAFDVKQYRTLAPTSAPTSNETLAPNSTAAVRRLLQQEPEFDYLTVNGTVEDFGTGTYQVDFSATQAATYSVFLAFGTNCVWNGTQYIAHEDDCWVLEYPNSVIASPFVTLAPTPYVTEPPPEDADTTAVTVTGVIVGIVTCCGLIFIFLGVRIRNQWRKDRAFIEKGRLAVLERGMELEGDNDLDTLQTKLQQTLHAVQAERAKNYDGQEAAIQRLLQQRGELQEMVRRLKLKREGIDPDSIPPPDQGFIARARKSIARKSLAPGTNRPYSRSMFKSVADDFNEPSVAAEGQGSGGGFLARMRQSMRRPEASKPTVSVRNPFVAGQAQQQGLQEAVIDEEEGGVSSENPLFNRLKSQTTKGGGASKLPEGF